MCANPVWQSLGDVPCRSSRLQPLRRWKLLKLNRSWGIPRSRAREVVIKLYVGAAQVLVNFLFIEERAFFYQTILKLQKAYLYQTLFSVKTFI
jgi:hypothetical protein